MGLIPRKLKLKTKINLFYGAKIKTKTNNEVKSL